MGAEVGFEKDLFPYLPDHCLQGILFLSLTSSDPPSAHLCLVLNRVCKRWKKLVDHPGFWRYTLSCTFGEGVPEVVEIDHKEVFVAQRAMSYDTIVKDSIVMMTDPAASVSSKWELYGNCKKLFQPTRTLSVIPKLMTCSLRILIDGYITVADSFRLYCSFYGLLMDFVNEYPELIEEANNLVAFADEMDDLQPEPATSVSVEDFISLLSITDAITWEDIGDKHLHWIYDESVDKKLHMQLLLIQLHMLYTFQPLVREQWQDEDISASMLKEMEEKYSEIMDATFERMDDHIPYYRDIVLLLRKSRAHILVVTADKLSQKVYVALLKKLEYSTITLVDNGMESVEAYGKSPYDVILMEIRMPSMSGWDAAKLIREKEKEKEAKRTPIIGMTCVLADRDIVGDIDNYLVLPLHKTLVQSIIEHYLMLGALKGDGDNEDEKQLQGNIEQELQGK